MSDERLKGAEITGSDRTGNPIRLTPPPRKRKGGSVIRKNGVVSRGTRSKAIRNLKTPLMTS